MQLKIARSKDVLGQLEIRTTNRVVSKMRSRCSDEGQSCMLLKGWKQKRAQGPTIRIMRKGEAGN